MKYLVVYERSETGYCAYAPDLPGYAAAAKSLDELRTLVREGIPFHLEGLREDGDEPPPAISIAAELVDVG